MRQHNYFPITLFFIILFAGLDSAIAEIPIEHEIKDTTTDYSLLVRTETSTLKDSSSSVPEQDNQNKQAPQPVGKTIIAEVYGPRVSPCRPIQINGDSWLDHMHDLVQEKTCTPAVWFDSFFGKEHVLEDIRPATLISLRNTARVTEGPAVIYIGDFNIALDLPHLENILKKFRIFIQSGYEADKYTTQPGQPVQPGVNRETGVRQTIIGLRLDPYTRLRSLVSIDSGIKINMHPDAFFRMRYQYQKDFKKVYLFRFSEIAMWQAVENFSNTSQIDIERKITTFSLIRWANSLTYIEDTPGITWNTGISIFTQITPKSAISYDTNMWGVNYPEWTIQNYRVGSHYRRNIFRPWLFFEFSPEVTWPEDEAGHRNPAFALMTTVEVQFGK